VGKIPELCPACSSSDWMITELTCRNCGNKVTVEAEPNLFSLLNPDDLNFITLFVQTKGNVKEMERELGISYWTIRRKLDEIVEFLNTPRAAVESPKAQRLAILERLRRGEITAQEAAALLESLKRGD
jgi:hypothetical protein